MQRSDDQQDTAVVEEDEAEAMVNILTRKASDNVVIEEVGTTEVGPPAPLCLSEEQTSVSGGIHSKSVSESTEDFSNTEKEMSVLDTIEDMIEESEDQGDGKDTAIVSSTGETQVLMVEASLKQGTLALDTVPVLSSGIYTEKEELPAQTNIEEKLFPVHMSSEVVQFPALIYIAVEEFPAQTPTEDQEFSIKTHNEEEETLAQTPGKKKGPPSQTHTDTEEFLVVTLAGKEELLAQTHIEKEEFSSQVQIQKDGFPVQTHLKEAKLPAQICTGDEELPAQPQYEKIAFPIQALIKEEEPLSQTPDKEGLPAKTPTETEEFLVLTSAITEELPAQLSAQTHTEKDAFPSQIYLDEAKRPAQTRIGEEEFSVEKEEVPVEELIHTNEDENNDVEKIELQVKEAEGDLVVDSAVVQLSEEDKIPKEVHGEMNEHAKEREFACEESQNANLESVSPAIEEEYICPDEKDESAGCESRTPTKKSMSFCEDIESFSHEPRESLRFTIYASASSPISKQGQAKPDGSQMSAALQLVSPCEEGHMAQEVEEKHAAGYENSIPSETLRCEKAKFYSEYGQKDENNVEEVLQEVTKMKWEVNTVSATAFVEVTWMV